MVEEPLMYSSYPPGGFGPGVVRTRGELPEPPQPAAMPPRSAMTNFLPPPPSESGRDKVLHLLSKLQLDTEEMGDKVWRRYEELYEGRRRRGEVRGSENREKVALAYSIMSVLNDEGAPRPFAHIADLCQLPRSHRRRVLHVEKTLRLSGRERGRGRGRTRTRTRQLDDDTEAAPDFVNSLCAQMGIPFSVSQQAERVLHNESVKWGLFGHRPQHLAAAAIEKVLLSRGMPSRERDLAREIGCASIAVRRLASKIPPELCLS